MRTKQHSCSTLEPIHSDAAGIDIGSQTDWVCVAAGCDANNVRSFGWFRADLHALADWLQACGIKSVAMESTGVFWIPLFQILETRGFEVKLVDLLHESSKACQK